MRHYNFFQPPKLIQQDENDVDQSKVIKCMTEFYEKRHKIVGTEEAIVSSHGDNYFFLHVKTKNKISDRIMHKSKL